MTPQPTSERAKLIELLQRTLRYLPDHGDFVLTDEIEEAIAAAEQPAPDTIETTVTWHRGGASGATWPFEKLESPLVKYRTTAGFVTTCHIYDHMWDKIVSWCYDADLQPPIFEERRDDR